MNTLITDAWSVRGLSATEKVVLVRLADFADKRGQCFPGHWRIASDCGLTERSVRSILPVLESKGHITIKREAYRSCAGRSVFTYTIHPTPENASSVTPEAASRDTGSCFPRHRKLLPATPENGASPNNITIIGTINEPSGEPPTKNFRLSDAERISLEKELDRIPDAIKKIEGKASHDAFGPIYTPEQKAMRKKLKDRKVEILERLGAVA